LILLKRHSLAKSIKESILKWYNRFWSREELLEEEDIKKIGEYTPMSMRVGFDIKVDLQD